MQAADEVPFITTPDHVTLSMLELAGVGASDHLIDLGSGDGRIVITAAKRFGASGLGVEIVPDLVARSIVTARQAGVEQRTEFRVQDLFTTDLSAATVITMYLLPEVNLALRPRLQQLAPGTRIVSHDWDLGDWLPDASRTIEVPDKPVGREKLSRLYLWVVPAQVNGVWCGTGAQQRLQLTVRQQHQRFDASLSRSGEAALNLLGRIDGTRLVALQGGAAAASPWLWVAAGAELHLAQTGDAAWSPAGARFVRAPESGCPAP
ncbi:SAM-dependent methyltransferase [Caldimonas caldifontis]|uniref:SAM-dependent methyltransferase n=1 Tax=Caldimonas caldifontis TaxID=1452508 RepID=A0A2S5SSE2_9BURK|nr:SAM-dependent methyltransferase [Caldimonas caldifontis]